MWFTTFCSYLIEDVVANDFKEGHFLGLELSWRGLTIEFSCCFI